MILACPVKSRGTVAMRFCAGIHVSSFIQKKLHNLGITRADSLVNWLPTILIRGIDNLWNIFDSLLQLFQLAWLFRNVRLNVRRSATSKYTLMLTIRTYLHGKRCEHLLIQYQTFSLEEARIQRSSVQLLSQCCFASIRQQWATHLVSIRVRPPPVFLFWRVRDDIRRQISGNFRLSSHGPNWLEMDENVCHILPFQRERTA